MARFHLPFGINASEKYSSCISKEEYKDLMNYAKLHNVRLEGFKRFSGSISLIKEFIDDVVVVAEDFPKILLGRRSLVIRLDERINDEDFATTENHLISINSRLFNNSEYLKQEYQMLADAGKFVMGTTYRSVAWHELGHIVANIYNINPLQIAKIIFPNKSDFEISEYIYDHLSQYASDYEDGREFISECFSAYYSEVDNWFAKEYVKKCKELTVKEGE